MLLICKIVNYPDPLLSLLGVQQVGILKAASRKGPATRKYANRFCCTTFVLRDA